AVFYTKQRLSGRTITCVFEHMRAIPRESMARTRALRIGGDPLAATGPHRIGADWIARSHQEPQPLRG
ncbi:MAG: hypothetical protein ACKO8U_15320, partial [Pirellula sp.]